MMGAPQVTALLLFTLVLMGAHREYKNYGTLVTPLAMIGLPYAIIVLAINLVGVHYGYFAVSAKANLYSIALLIAFVIGGKLITSMYGDNVRREEELESSVTDAFQEMNLFFQIVAGLTLFAGLLQFRSVISALGIQNINSNDFREMYAAGILGHLMLWSRPAFYILFANSLKRFSKINLLLLIGIFVMIAIRQVKYHIIVLILGALLLAVILGSLKVTWRKTLYGVVGVYAIFNLSYVIGFSVSGLDYAYSEKVQSFLFNHFFTYLFGGPIGFSEILNIPTYPHGSIVEMLAVPLNVYKAILGDSQYVDIIIRQWLPISTITQYFHASNTFGLFGMMYAYAGVWGSLLAMTFLGMFSYFLFLESLRSEKTIYALLWAYQSAYLILSFFGFYFNMVPFYEIFVYLIILTITAKFSIQVQRRQQMVRT